MKDLFSSERMRAPRDPQPNLLVTGGLIGGEAGVDGKRGDNGADRADGRPGEQAGRVAAGERGGVGVVGGLAPGHGRGDGGERAALLEGLADAIEAVPASLTLSAPT
jgi:hypothetical protein